MKIKLTLMALLFTLMSIGAWAESYSLTLGDRQELPKTMKGKNWSLLSSDGTMVLAYQMSRGTLTLARFDKQFNVQKETALKKLPENLVCMNEGEQTIDAVVYDKNNVVHLAFDKQSLELKKQEVMIQQETCRKFADKYSDVYARWSDNGKYLVLFAIWDHSKVGLAYSSNHIYLYNDRLEPIANWSLDEDKRCVEISDSKGNSALWQLYHPNFELTDDGTIYYVATQAFASNLYSDQYGSGTTLSAHVLSPDGSRQDFDFGKISGNQFYMYPTILDYDADKLVLMSNYSDFPKNGVDYSLLGYKVLTCNLKDKTVSEQTYERPSGKCHVNLSVKDLSWTKRFTGKSYRMMMGGRYFYLLDANQAIDFDGDMGAAYMNNAQRPEPGWPFNKSESNSALVRKFIGTQLYWLDVRQKWNATNPFDKMAYQTTLRLGTFDADKGDGLVVKDIWQQNSKEALSISCCRLTDNRYLLLLNNCQWAELELK